MPDNLKPADHSNPYADYRPSNLYTFLAKQTVAKTILKLPALFQIDL
jgi:hypothetical protein